MAILTVERRPVVAIDADETLVQFRRGVAKYAREGWGITYPVYQIHPDPTQIQDDMLIEIIEDFLYQADRVEQLKPYPGAKTGLRILHEKGYAPHLVSARMASVLGETTDRWVEAYGFRPYIAGIHLNDGSSSGPRFKVLKVQELGAMAAFDDDDLVAQRYAEEGIPVFHIRRSNHRARIGKVSHPLINPHRSFLLGVRAFLNFAKLKSS